MSITTDAEHLAALQEVEHLWDAAPGSRESDRLNQLVDEVVAYEEVRWPNLGADQ